MDEFHHRGHVIRVEVRTDLRNSEWLPTLTIVWNLPNQRLGQRRVTLSRTFAVYDEAEECARSFAVTWIDAGKPELPEPWAEFN
jgi:hypothetical protein